MDQDALTEREISFEEAAAIFGIPEFTEEYLYEIGTPNPEDYEPIVEIPVGIYSWIENKIYSRLSSCRSEYHAGNAKGIKKGI